MVSTVQGLSWEESKKLTEQLDAGMMPVTKENLEKMVAIPGIIAWYYGGDQLGTDLWHDEGRKLIYVGRGGKDALRHFVSGNTENSTIRKSLTALLHNKYDLKPIPGKGEDKYTNYSLDEVSDDRLTSWIEANIQVSFVEVHPDQLEEAKQGLINYNTPMFNLQNNPENKYGADIKMYRKQCADLAKDNE